MLLTACAECVAQSFPSKPVRLIVPFTAGASSNDVLARALSARLSNAMGQQVIVENRPGANGNTGSEYVAKAAPDGYTLLIGANGPLAISPSIYSKLGYDPVRDFAPIAMLAIIPYVMLVHPSVPANSIKELIALAKTKPGQLHFASSGIGSTPHLCGELFKNAAQIDIVHVPYKGGASAATDIAGGHVEIHCAGITGAISLFKSGKLRALALASRERSSLLPELPTMSEAGVPGFEVNSWTGVLAPARTSPEIVRRLHGQISKILQSPEMQQFIRNQGSEPGEMTPEQFSAHLRAEIAKWAIVVKSAKIELR